MRERLDSRGVSYMDETPDVENNTERKAISEFNSELCEITQEMMGPMTSNENAIQTEIKFMLAVKQMYEFMNTNRVDMGELYDKLDANYGVVTADHVSAFAGLNILPNRDRYSIGEIFDVPNKQVYAMFIQNNSHAQHSKRRDAAEGGTYVYPFSDSSHVLIKGMVDSAVRSETTRRMTIRQSGINDQYGKLFRETDDIMTAAGIILEECKNMGDQSFCSLYVQLQTSQPGMYIPLIVEKTRLLVEGEYQGVRLYKDKTEHHNAEQPFRWVPTYRNMIRIMKTYEKQSMREHGECDMTADDWMEVFRWKYEVFGDFKTEVLREGSYPRNRRSSKRGRTTFSEYRKPNKKARQ